MMISGSKGQKAGRTCPINFYITTKKGYTPMIKHIVMFKLKENAEGKTKQETIVEAKKRLSVFEAEIPTLKKLVVAINDEKAAESNYELALICDFDDIEGLNAYQIHPTHKAFGAFITPLRESRACIDYEF